MELADLLKNSIITGIELHSFFLILVLLLYRNMRKSYLRNGRKLELSLSLVYIGVILTIISDCVWSTVSSKWTVSDSIGYVVNLVYFIFSALAAASWYIFCAQHLDIRFKKSKIIGYIAMLPYAIVTVFYLLSPVCGLIFSIQNGEYVRGPLFVLDPIIKMGYIGLASLIALMSGNKKPKGYLRKKDYNYIVFGIPVLIAGILQSVSGVDFNCLGITFGLILIYKAGISNKDRENTDALYSLGNSFGSAYIVNMDTGVMRSLRSDILNVEYTPEVKSNDYNEHFTGIFSRILVPEDREVTMQTFALENVAKRFIIDNSFSIRYRVKDRDGHVAIHSAFFINADGSEGKREFLIGINVVDNNSLLYERNEALNNDGHRLEDINTSIIESVAKIVDARDNESGGHIVRVKKITEIIGRDLMNNYPELNLDEDTVKLISSASVLHDVGKIVIPDAVLLKPGRLTPEEFEIMKTHTTKGYEILNLFPLGLDDAFLEYALTICRWHHERYDGNGYPDKLIGDDIPIAAQIVSIADCYDALVSERPYKPAYSPEIACDMILHGKCGAFSAKLLESLKRKKGRLAELSRLYK